MFVNFESIFGNKSNQNSNKTPEVVISYFNSIAPKGTHYTIESDGTFILEPIPGNLDSHIQGLQFENDDFLIKKLGDQYNFANIARYAYNSQKELKLIPTTEGEIRINGEPLPMSLFAFKPNRKRNYSKGTSYFLLKPHPFPEPVRLEISNEKYSRIVYIQRAPNDSLDKKTFETQSDELLGLKFILNDTEDTLNLTFQTNLINEKSVRRYVEVYSLCSSFIDGTIRFNGVPLEKLDFNESNSVFSYENLIFWEKVLKIEDALGISFQPANVQITSEVLNTVEELYQTLVNNMAVKCDVRIDSFDSGVCPSNNEEDGKSIIFVFASSSSYELFKKTIVIPSIFGVFNCRISHVDKAGSAYRVHLEDKSADKPMQVSKLNYRDFSTRDSINSTDTDLLQKLVSARSIRDYLDVSKR
jgi:hypothetical protein